MEGFPTGFSRMTSLPVWTPPAKVPHPRRRPPPTIIWPTRHCTIYAGDAPPPPSMCFCLHSVTNGDEGLEFSRVSRFGLGVVLSTEGFPTGFSLMTSLPVRTPPPRPRCPTLDADPLRPLLGPPAIVPYIRGRPANRIARMFHAHTHTRTHKLSFCYMQARKLYFR